MSATLLTRKLVLFGPFDALQGFARPDFLHNEFFVHCFTRDELRNEIVRYQNTTCEMDIFLPDTAVDLIGYYNDLLRLPKQFHLYCETDDLVDKYERRMQPNMCEVFNTNELEEQLYDRASLHLLHCINNLKKRSKKGDVDADDLLLPMGELFEQCAAKINEYIRQRSCLPSHPAEHEER